MGSGAGAYSIRDCAGAVAAAFAAAGDDPKTLAEGLRAPMRRLMERDDLLEAGLPRQGNNVAFSSYLYFDGDLTFIIFGVPKGKPIQPHDHGIWESLFVYRGRLKHTTYRRTDDGARAGHAELAVASDGVLERGDFAVVAPPADIHGFTALDEDTFGISVVRGEYKPDRHYYRPDEKTYEVRGQKTSR